MFEDFSPPETGLNPGEEVVWSRRAGMAAMMMLGGACCILGFPWILLIASVTLGATITNILLVIILIGIFLTIIEFVNSRRTWYYLTTQRIVEARGGLVRTQIPLEHFQGLDPKDYLVIKSTYREGVKTFYQARIRVPDSGKLMILTGLDEDAKEIILKMGNQT